MSYRSQKRRRGNGGRSTKGYNPSSDLFHPSGRRKTRSKMSSAGIVRGYTRRSGYYGRFVKGGELKFWDVSRNAAIKSAGAVEASLNLIPQGVTESERVGRKCTIKKIAFRGALILRASTTSAATSSLSRVMLVQDKQANGAVPVVTDILETAGVLSWNNLANSGRFKVLMDEFMSFKAAGAAASGAAFVFSEDRKMLSCYKEVTLPLEFSSTTGAITEIRSNNLLLVTIGDVDDYVDIIYEVRLRYEDN